MIWLFTSLFYRIAALAMIGVLFSGIIALVEREISGLEAVWILTGAALAAVLLGLETSVDEERWPISLVGMPAGPKPKTPLAELAAALKARIQLPV